MTRDEMLAAIEEAEQRIISAAIDYAARPAGSGPAHELHVALNTYRDALLAPARIVVDAAVRTWSVLDLTNRLGDGGRNAHKAGVWWLEEFGGECEECGGVGVVPDTADGIPLDDYGYSTCPACGAAS